MLRIALAALLLALCPSPASGIGVEADDLADAYLISGSTFLDQSFPGAAEASTCTDCHWRVIRICESGGLDERRGCNQLPITCTDALAEVWFATGATQPLIGDPVWEYRGLMCLDAAPVSASVVHQMIPDIAQQFVPTLKPGSTPALVSLTNLSTRFHTGQPAAFSSPPLHVAGATVVLHLQPEWRWDFGSGAPLITHLPGRAGKTSEIRYRYPRRGLYRVRVDGTWHSTYDVNGIPASSLPDDIHQSAWFTLRVREARRYLTPTRSTL